MSKRFSPQQQAVQIVTTWNAIDEAQRTDSLLRYYIALAIKDAGDYDRDHCTPEERAVIEALVSYHQSQSVNHSEDAENCQRCRTKTEFDFAVSQLLASRSKSETPK